MKKFLIRLWAIILILFTILFIVIVMGNYLSEKSSYKITPEKHILIIGNSHTECAINDSIFSSAENKSSSGEHYMFSYLKAKKLLECNPQIDTLILPVAENVISKYYDDRWATGEALTNHTKNNVFFADFDDIPLLIYKNTDFILGLLRAPLDITLSLATKKGVITGGYHYLDVNKINKDHHNVKTPDAVIDTTSLQYAYLIRIKDLCSTQNIKLILINTPKYNPIRVNRQKFDSLRMAFIPDIAYVDFADFPLADSCYADSVHLNYKGANIFSEYLKNNGLKSFVK